MPLRVRPRASIASLRRASRPASSSHRNCRSRRWCWTRTASFMPLRIPTARFIVSSAQPGGSQTDKTKPACEFSSSVYFDPGTKYIWDLVFDGSGNLYVATGDHGEIFRVTPKGEHSVFFKSDEAHIRVLSMDAKGNLIAGSDGSGLVYGSSPVAKVSCSTARPKKKLPRWPSTKRATFMLPVSERSVRASAPPVFPSPMPNPTPTPTAGAGQPGMVVLNVNPPRRPW